MARPIKRGPRKRNEEHNVNNLEYNTSTWLLTSDGAGHQGATLQNRANTRGWATGSFNEMLGTTNTFTLHPDTNWAAQFPSQVDVYTMDASSSLAPQTTSTRASWLKCDVKDYVLTGSNPYVRVGVLSSSVGAGVEQSYSSGVFAVYANLTVIAKKENGR